MIGQKIIKQKLLTTQEANTVSNDLIQLETGVWDVPDWAKEVGNHYEVGAAHSVVQLAGWKAVAMAYKNKLGEQK
jgi:hypothetical protein